MELYGLIGHPLGHSFSQAYFNEKFHHLHPNSVIARRNDEATRRLTDRREVIYKYENFDLEDISLIENLLKNHPNLKGFNVTSPYKESIMPYLSGYEPAVAEIQAVNTVKVLPDGRLWGYNTDILGFKTLLEESGFQGSSALVLGTGGASKAVQYVLRQKGIAYQLVSRDPLRGDFTFFSLTPCILEGHPLLINTTPLGTFPKVDESPLIPYEAITPRHILIDLVYNPSETLFLRQGHLHGAKTFNGLTMLHAQAAASWKIWQNLFLDVFIKN